MAWGSSPRLVTRFVTQPRASAPRLIRSTARPQQEDEPERVDDFAAALASRELNWDRVVELSQVIRAERTESVNTIFKSVGMAIEDVALGAKLLELIGGS